MEGGTIKAIAIPTRNRSPALPALPSAHEQGLANFEAYGWNAIFLPKGTPDAIVRKLNAALVATLDTPSVRERMKEIGADIPSPDRRSPEFLQKFVESEIEKWAGPIKAAGVSTD